MSDRTLDQYTRLSEHEALREYFDAKNARFFRRFRNVFIPVSFVLVIVNAVARSPVDLSLALFDLALLIVVVLASDSDWITARIRSIVIASLFAQQLILVGLSRSAILTVVLSSIVFPAMFLFVRLSAATYAALGASFATSCIVATTFLPDAGPERIAIPLIFNTAAAFGAAKLATSDRRSFLHDWRIISSKERERLRMRDELADARKIQLAMLPLAPPRVDWLDLASLSLPATEVGGDFYDYFTLPGGQVAIVIGDVAGHGVASGIVLAGVKSGLHLLQDELLSPVGAVEKLNRVVRDWLQWRMFVSMLVVVADRKSRTLSVVTAGHPPLMHFSVSTGSIRHVGSGALPLGTRLPASYRVDAIDVSDADCFVVYTDGVTEQANARGEIFGEERLARAFTKSAPSGKPRIIREAITDELAHFKGDAPQLDDVSLVIGRLHRIG